VSGARHPLDGISGRPTAMVDLRESLGPVSELVIARAQAGDVVVVGLAGGVAVGKTFAAGVLASVLSDHDGRSVEVVSTDGFLLPNAELDRLGLAARKGFPESYDHARLVDFLDEVRAGHDVMAPRYDHLTYDVVVDGGVLVKRPDVLVLEGVNALQAPLVDRLDLAVYLHADEEDLRRWYQARIRQLRADAPGDGSSFYDAFATMSDDEFAVVADAVWESVNHPNLVDYIEPSRARADVVIEKAADHSIRSLHVRHV
jgi:type I pantothenate kinase